VEDAMSIGSYNRAAASKPTGPPWVSGPIHKSP
jgi:hypothetical protein